MTGPEPAPGPAGDPDPVDPDPVGPDPVDPDVDLRVAAERTRPRGPVLAAVAAGGVVGACARYAAGLLWPDGPTAFPWTTLWINVLGCALIGVLMALVAEGGRDAHPLLRPFAGTGVLGGFTTFSAYALDVSRLLDVREAGVALAYAGLTVAGALAAVLAGATLTRRAVRIRRSPAGRGSP
ncbi:CrcB family protein [Streptomyces sp. NPDC017949]|uniref:CrcB family protein n=1 Tax=Streptomyces sp. NPDC017949 TaxID=3365020 RepID=UPI0037B39901